MIAFLEGILAGKNTSTAFVNVGGVGYAVAMSQGALAKLPETGNAISVFTYLQVSENGIALYGFLTLEEKALFERLISVSGVGPKVALAALSAFSPADLISAIAAQDIARVQKIPGVGKKTASRIILELKGSFDEGVTSLFDQDASTAVDAAQKAALEALLSMGFSSAEAELALKGAPAGQTESKLLQYALKRLGA
ncbi:Holliday junction branch migration protein RuvA [Eggerthellaceae bacterium 3-80]|nr:Holliday junction branch migration protein RuvA [bacterium D16-34]